SLQPGQQRLEQLRGIRTVTRYRFGAGPAERVLPQEALHASSLARQEALAEAGQISRPKQGARQLARLYTGLIRSPLPSATDLLVSGLKCHCVSSFVTRRGSRPCALRPVVPARHPRGLAAKAWPPSRGDAGASTW